MGATSRDGDEPAIGTRAERAVFAATLATTFVAEQLLWDGQFITYPLFRRVRDPHEGHFVKVHQDYVKSLGLPTYLPMSLYLLCCALFLRYRPPRVPLRFPILMNTLNALGVASTFLQLVPLHIRIDTEERASAADVDRLIAYNRIRFGCVGVNSAIMLYLLGRVLGQSDHPALRPPSRRWAARIGLLRS